MNKFGVSTHLYHEQRLQKAHLLEIARKRIRSGRGLRNAQPFRLPRPGGDSIAGRVARRVEARAALGPRADHGRLRERQSQRTFSTATQRQPKGAKRHCTRWLPRWRSRRPCRSSFSSCILAFPTRSIPTTDDNNREAAIRSVEEIHEHGRAARRSGGPRSDGKRPLDGARI